MLTNGHILIGVLVLAAQAGASGSVDTFARGVLGAAVKPASGLALLDSEDPASASGIAPAVGA